MSQVSRKITLVFAIVFFSVAFILFAVAASETTGSTVRPYHPDDDSISYQEVGHDIDSGQALTYSVKSSPTPDGATPIGLARGTPAAPQTLNYHAYLPIVKEAGFNLKVFVVAYITDSGESRDPRVPITPSVAINTLTTNLIADLKLGSTWHGSTLSGTPMLNFTVYSMTLLYEQAPLQDSNGLFDYDALYNRFDICNMGVDEVWVWGNRDTKMNESVVEGPTWSMTTGSLPNCGKTMTTFGFNYYRDVSQALHSYSHSIEYMMQVYVPAGPAACDFRTSHYDFSIFMTPTQCTGALAISDTYGFVARAWPVNSNVGTCGWTHQPPNDAADYLVHHGYYGMTNTVQIRCTNWVWGGTSTVAFDCHVYNCDPWTGDPGDTYQFYVHNLIDEEKFHIWWMQNLPGDGNTSQDRGGLTRSNWWVIKFQ